MDPHALSVQVSTLLPLLADFDVELPEDLRRTGDQMLRLSAFRPGPTIPDRLVGLSDADLTEAMRQLSLGHAVHGSGGPAEHAEQQMRHALALAVAAELRPLVDDVLDQLRPRFDEAAAAVHKATELGIHGGTQPGDLLRADNVADLRDAYAQVVPASRTLSAIAHLRIDLSKVTGAPPVPRQAVFTRLVESVEDYAGAMFRDDGRPWRQDFERGDQLWLRLCAGTPARLLTIAESAAAAGQLDATTDDDEDDELVSA